MWPCSGWSTTSVDPASWCPSCSFPRRCRGSSWAVAGAAADRFDRRKIIVTVSTVQVVAALMLLTVGPGRLWLAFVAQAAISALGAFVLPAAQAAVPNLTRDAEELEKAAALFGSTKARCSRSARRSGAPSPPCSDGTRPSSLTPPRSRPRRPGGHHPASHAATSRRQERPAPPAATARHEGRPRLRPPGSGARRAAVIKGDVRPRCRHRQPPGRPGDPRARRRRRRNGSAAGDARPGGRPRPAGRSPLHRTGPVAAARCLRRGRPSARAIWA